ncbi:MAG: glycosyltransferase [Salibacteraceae bacterium]
MEIAEDNVKKIVVLGPAHPFRGGIADTNEAMARAFKNQGHSVDLITFSVQYPSFLFPGKSQFSDEPAPKELKIHRWMHSMNPFSWIKTAIKINKMKPDVVIIRYWLPLMAPCLGTIAWLLNGSVKVIGLTDNVIPHEKRALDKALTKYFMAHCDAFMALSKAVEDDLKSLTDKPTSYFPHPINDQLGTPVEITEAKLHLGLKAEDTFLLFFGFIRRYKGLDLLLEAMADERIKALGLKLIIAGESYESMDLYSLIIDKHKLNDNVILQNKFIPASEVPYYFGATDLVTQTYRSATQSGITQMALHFEVPALITKVGGLNEFIVEGRTGLFCEPNPESIANAILEFFAMDHEPFKKAIREEKQRFSWNAFVDHFLISFNI